jgi:hypothetical protein
MEGSSPIESTPAVWADFNARGWAGGSDTAFYALDPNALAEAQPEQGKRVFLWDEDEPDTILGCVAILEHVSFGQFTGWRAVPVEGAWYRGPKPAFVPAKLGA